MTIGKKSLTVPAQLAIMVCVLVLFLGVNTAEAQIRTVLVSPVPGNPVASGTALRNALAGISSPSSTDRWLLKIEPGIYDVGTTSLQMRSWVDIEGSGIGVTTIRGSASPYFGTIHGANDAELRLLTVEANNGSIAMANYQASPRLYRVSFLAQGASAWGVRNFEAAPVIEECEISATATATFGAAYGLVFAGYPPASRRSSILRSKVNVSGPRENYGVWIAEALSLTSIRDSSFDILGGTSSYGLYATQTPEGPWVGNEPLTIRNTGINSWGGSTASYGIKFEPGTTIYLVVNSSTVFGHLAPTTYGILQGGASAVVTQWSHIIGFTQTIQSAASASIQSTHLQGGPATAAGWLGCMGVWDENGIFYTQACP